MKFVSVIFAAVMACLVAAMPKVTTQCTTSNGFACLYPAQIVQLASDSLSPLGAIHSPQIQNHTNTFAIEVNFNFTKIPAAACRLELNLAGPTAGLNWTGWFPGVDSTILAMSLASLPNPETDTMTSHPATVNQLAVLYPGLSANETFESVWEPFWFPCGEAAQGIMLTAMGDLILFWEQFNDQYNGLFLVIGD